MVLLDTIRQRLFSDSAYLATEQGIRKLDLQGEGGILLVARALSIFRTLDVGSVPASRQEAVIESQVSLLSPFEVPGYWYVVQQGTAKIWIWDAQRLEQLAAGQAVSLAEYEILPETCFGDQTDDGLVLYECASGFVAQAWDSGSLVMDHFWADRPGEYEFNTVLRGAGLQQQPVPEVVPLNYAALAAWVSRRPGGKAFISMEPGVLMATLAVFVVLFSFQLSSSIRLMVETERTGSEIAAMSARHEQAIIYRQKAFEARELTLRYHELKKAGPLTLINLFALSLPESSGQLIRWQFSEDSLEAVVVEDAPDLESYVRQLEEVPYLGQVMLEPLPRPGHLRVKAEVHGQ